MSQNTESMVILMADDNADDRLLTKEAFEENKLKNDIRFVVDGEDLMDYLHQQKVQYSKFAPAGNYFAWPEHAEKDGREALADQIRSWSEADPHDHSHNFEQKKLSFKSYDLGVNSFITKPVTFDNLVLVVAKLGQYWLQIVKLLTNNCNYMSLQKPYRVLVIDDDRRRFFSCSDYYTDGGREKLPILEWAPHYAKGRGADDGRSASRYLPGRLLMAEAPSDLQDLEDYIGICKW